MPARIKPARITPFRTARRLGWTLWLLGLACLAGEACGQSSAPPADPAVDGEALFRSLFDPLRAPPAKAMGLLQSSFLDALDQSRAKLQVAWVIDGTTSMAPTLEALKKSLPDMVADLRRRHADQVSFALVVYRDQGAASGRITVPLQGFVTDPEAFLGAVRSIEAESGAPYFLEPVDEAVHRALELPWDESPETTRWMIVAADAPPFGDGLEDAPLGAVRKYSTQVLIDAARRRDVVIHGLLCRSNPEEYAAFQQVLDRTQRFLGELARGAGGQFLDTSLEEVRAELARRSQALRAKTANIGLIDEADVRQAQASLPQRISVAVLPHAPLSQMSFDTSQPAGVVALELQEKLRRLPGVHVKSINAVQRAFRMLSQRDASQLSAAQINAALAAQMEADFIIWGRVKQENGALQADSGVFDGRNGTLLAQSRASAPPAAPERAGGVVILASTLAAAGYRPPAAAAPDDPRLRDLLQAMQANRQALSVVLSEDAQVQQWLLDAYRDLEAATAFAIGDPDADGLLRSAETLLRQALDREPRHPWAHYLLANCLFNQARIYSTTAQAQLMKSKADQVRPALNLAYRDRRKLPTEMLIRQIEADHALLVDRKPQEAAALYEEVAHSDAAPESVRRSATWMLLGIHLGDWGSGEPDPRQARQAAIAILARWPDSPEAQFLRKVLRWKDGDGALYAQLPLINQVVMD